MEIAEKSLLGLLEKEKQYEDTIIKVKRILKQMEENENLNFYSYMNAEDIIRYRFYLQETDTVPIETISLQDGKKYLSYLKNEMLSIKRDIAKYFQFMSVLSH